MKTAWERLGQASDWAAIASRQAQLPDSGYAQLLMQQPLFQGAAMLYGPRPHPLLLDGDQLAQVQSCDPSQMSSARHTMDFSLFVPKADASVWLRRLRVQRRLQTLAQLQQAQVPQRNRPSWQRSSLH